MVLGPRCTFARHRAQWNASPKVSSSSVCSKTNTKVFKNLLWILFSLGESAQGKRKGRVTTCHLPEVKDVEKRDQIRSVRSAA